jgi:hypothetical protein
MSVLENLKRLVDPRPRWLWWLRALWVLILLIFIAFLVFGVSNNLGGNLSCAPIKIYSADRRTYVEWERAKAIEFGMDQSATIIKFLFVAAAALLGYLSKTLLDPLLAKESNVQIPPVAFALLRHSAIGCCFSLLYGFMGFTFFMYVPVVPDFSPFAEVGIAGNCQQLSLLAAACLMLTAIGYMWRHPRRLSQTIHQGN